MKHSRPIHPDFNFYLELKDQPLIDLFTDLRDFIIELHPDANELIYQTHALTSVFSISEKLSDAYSMINIYSNHLNLGFNKGTLLKDPHKILEGTGNLIRHIPVKDKKDYRNEKVKALLKEAIDFAVKDMTSLSNLLEPPFQRLKSKRNKKRTILPLRIQGHERTGTKTTGNTALSKNSSRC